MQRREDSLMAKKQPMENWNKMVEELEKEAIDYKCKKEVLQTILNLVPVIIFQKDRDGKTIRTNQAFDTMIGLSKEEIIGKTTDELFPEHGKDMIKDDQEVMELGKPKLDIIERYDSPEGTRWARTGKAPIKDKKGNVVGLIGYAADITEQKQLEEALRESEEKYRSLTDDVLDSSAVGIFILDSDFKVIWVNRALEDYFGLKRDEIIGKDKRQLIHERIKDIFENPDSFAHKVFTIYDDNTHIEHFECHVLPNCEREERWLEHRSQPIQSGIHTGGRIEHYYDITTRKKAEEEKQKLQSQLQRALKMEAIGTLAGGVAHDLNNVLGAQVSYPDLILMDLPEDSPLRKPILTIQQSGQKAAAIVQDLLTLARRGVVATEVVNLNQVINSYLSSPEHEKLKEFHLDAKIESDLETNLLNIMGSPVHLSKTIMNLVSNAAEAMPDGGNIFISAQSKYIDKLVRGYDDIKEGDYVILTVSDTGIGISSEDIERIFEPFYTKKVMGRSGTGLGMAVVWGTVKDHKGYIDIQSTEGKGTTFTLYFPVTRKEISGKEKALPMEEYMGKGESILVVDDIEEQKEIASRILKKLGYSVNTVSSGEEAVDYMKENSADLLILDMIMDPGIDGLETYKRILEFHPGQKAIITSGFSETDRVKEAQRLGAGKYIKKPYTLEKIGMAVKNELS